MGNELKVVLFDLDGTISDSARGILAALRHSFAVNGLPRMDAATERAVLGPPFYESLPPLIGDVLCRLGDPHPSAVIMIGDREHDVLGARAHGIEAIGVRWGYGPPGELEGARPFAIAATASEVLVVLQGRMST